MAAIQLKEAAKCGCATKHFPDFEQQTTPSMYRRSNHLTLTNTFNLQTVSMMQSLVSPPFYRREMEAQPSEVCPRLQSRLSKSQNLTLGSLAPHLPFLTALLTTSLSAVHSNPRLQFCLCYALSKPEAQVSWWCKSTSIFYLQS